jgi:transmembrane sensor
MNPQRPPLAPLLQQAASEEELQRVWRGIQKQRARKPVRPTPWLILALACCAVLGIVSWRSLTKNTDVLRDQADRAPLLLESGSARTTTLSDGSRVELSADSAVEVLENDGRTFVCALRRGRATFDVVPGGPRRWRVEAGAVAVEVVGTRFRVDRGQNNVVVEVERGAVLVRGDGVRDGVQRLEAGARLEIVPERPVKTEAEQPSLPPTPSSAVATRTSGSVPSAVGTASAEPASPDLLALADRQRRRGDLVGAIQTLKLAVERAPDDGRASMAAFTLGKLLLDGVARPVEAQAAFRSCLKRSPPAAIAEDALARLVEAQARSGARRAALDTAREYEKRYPNGRRLADVRRWTATP